MWLILSTTGLYQIKLSDLKFYTKVKGWKCNLGSHVYNYLMHDDLILSDSICRSNADYKIETYDKKIQFNDTMFVCPKENCYCGMDIGIPKGKTEEDIKTLREQFFELYPEKLSTLKWYDDSGEVLAFALSDFITKELIHIDWFLGKRCNFDCSYCSPTIHDNISPHKTFSELVDAYKYLLSCIGKIRNDQKIGIIFHGGEPTLNPDYLGLINYIAESNTNISIRTLTNLTRSAEYLFELNKVSDITYSVHLEYLTEKFINKAEYFFSLRDKSSKNLTVKIMYLSKYKDKIMPLLSTLGKYKNITYSITPLHKKDSKLLYDYTDNDKKFFKISGKT